MEAHKSIPQQTDRAMEHELALGHLQTLDQTAPLDLDSTNLLKNLDELRKMQIDLAMEHLALGSVPAERVSLLDMEQDEDSSRRYKKNAERFAKKEADVNNLMIRLEELSEAMRNFHFSMDETRATASGGAAADPSPKSGNWPGSTSPQRRAVERDTSTKRSSGRTASVDKGAPSTGRAR